MQKNKWILNEAVFAKERGIQVDVDGVDYTNKPVESLSKVLEDGSYMLDYEGDTQGHIVALHIDLVEPFQKPSTSHDSLMYKNKHGRRRE